ncbi:autotransporter domain-containing protein [Synechococcus sp. MU1611]|uniref:autotransporter domain-containing protein n=1 Tax=Synechococcus sp. MU1611 TaxID=2508345 RepID=UPI001CF8F5D6|nr:autotransporter domain-containing protein [Synechococcus sp. MU1611]
MSRKLLSGLSLGIALSVSAAHAQAAPSPVGSEIASSGVVKIYTLPSEMQTVVEGDDGYYAINYYTWSDPKSNPKIEEVPGISLGQWWTDEKIGKFFPWGDDEKLAERLSDGYRSYAETKGLLDANGDLNLNGYDNGGGFIFGNWKGSPPLLGTQRPDNDSTRGEGLMYEWNSIQYYTEGGNDNRIQAFGGCAVNAISAGERPTTGNGPNGLIKSATNPCVYDSGENVVAQDRYAPVFEGGTLVTVEDVPGEVSNTELDVPFWVGSEGGTIDNDGINTAFNGAFKDVFVASFSGVGDLAFTGKGITTLAAENTYTGNTNILEGTLRVTGTLSNSTAVSISDDATYEVANSDEVGSIEGAGNIVIAEDQMLTAGGLDTATTVSGEISGGGGFMKVGDGTLTFSGVNTYQGETTVDDGILLLANLSAIPRESPTFVTGTGQLDLRSEPTGKGEFKIDRLSIKEGGKVFVSPDQPLVSKTITLDAYSLENSNPGGIITSLDGRTNPPLRVSESFDYDSGTLVVAIPEEYHDVELDDDGKARYQIIDGNVENINDLAENTYIVVSEDQIFSFDGIGEENAKDGPALYKGYLAEGSLELVVEAKDPDEIICDLHPDSDECKEEPNKPDPDPPICDLYPALEECKEEPNKPDPDEPVCEGDECKNDKPDPLPGCEEDDDLCDVISDIDGDEDEAWEEEEEVAVEIIDAVLDGVEDEEIDLLLGFDYGQLAKLVGSGLAPRNVDAAGRGLALHNNLLVDAVFDRQPLRQFEELLISEEVVEESVVEEEAVIEQADPVQPLWLKAEELGDGEATAYVEGAVAEVEVADVEVNGEVAVEVETEEVVIELDGVSLVDQQDDELDLAKRDGVSAWVKGFGGNSRADESSILYNDYDLSAYGTSFGVDVALSESFQIGAYANYGDLNVNQLSGDTGGGSWNPEGWGGGITAQYSTRHFYLQGLLGASEFSGEQSRHILRINSYLGGNTAKGDKSVTSYLGALRIGAPFKTGGVVLEPQGQVVWTRNQEQGFSESHGTEKNLRLKYKSRTTNFAETELGMKLSVPIRTGERSLLVPSLRAAWLADWNQANEGQEIGYNFTKKTVNFDSQLGTENGALLEAGLDYTVQNFNGISVKLYGRGGMEFWASDRGTTWRASGGVTFQF